MAVGVVLFSRQFFVGFFRESIQEFCVQQTTRCFFTAPLIVNLVQSTWQQHMRGTGVDVISVPFHQGDFIQCRRAFRFVSKEHACPWAALNPKVADLFVLFETVIGAVKPRRYFNRVLTLVVHRVINATLWVHIQQHRAERADRRRIQPIR